MNLAKLYIQNAISEFQKQKSLGEKTIEQISEKELHWQINEESNSMAIIIQHMHGNMMSRWTNFLTEDGEKDWRKRDEEFEEQTFNKESLLTLWEEGWSTLFNTLNLLTEENLSKEVTIRNQKLYVVEAINRQLTHYAYHVGQIVFLGKQIRGSGWINLSIPKK
jgi:hypothetical protein